MSKGKKHWNFGVFVCTGRKWQASSMHFTSKKADVNCRICRSLLRIQGKL